MIKKTLLQLPQRQPEYRDAEIEPNVRKSCLRSRRGRDSRCIQETSTIRTDLMGEVIRFMTWLEKSLGGLNEPQWNLPGEASRCVSALIQKHIASAASAVMLEEVRKQVELILDYHGSD